MSDANHAQFFFQCTDAHETSQFGIKRKLHFFLPLAVWWVLIHIIAQH